MALYFDSTYYLFIIYANNKDTTKKQIYQYAYSWLVCGGLIILLQFAYAFSLKMVPIWDSRNIINESARMLTDQVPQISSVNGYFDMYGNNYPIVIFLYNYYRILDFFILIIFGQLV